MYRRPHLIACLVLLAMTGACKRETPDMSQADKAAVQATIDKYVQTAVTANWDAWGQTLTSDVFYSPPNLAPMNGRDAAVAWAKTFPKIMSLTSSVDEIAGRGDVAFARGSYTLTVTLPDGSPMADRGAFLGIHRRQPDGTWPYSDLIYHSTEPLPAPPARIKE